ncbi:MAG: IS630 family transposase, partial [Kribbellaceae bacterium]
WFKHLTDRRLRRGIFTSVPDLIQAITTWVDHGNTNPKPFTWHAKAEDIIAKVRRGRTALPQVKSKTQH